MTVLDIAKVTSKGQVTIPNKIRKMLHLHEGVAIAFSLGKEGILILPCEVTPKSPYTKQEWAKIKKLAAEKGKVYRSPGSAKTHIEQL